jgi:PAS domain S-box-containing protein
MAWLAGGVAYSVGYVLVGWLLRGHAHLLLAFRVTALLVPPMTGVIVIARRRNQWTGCHWLFWATIALGLTMSAIGLIGWTVDELLLRRETSWLGWHTVFALFGAAAPLFALLTQPHRGSREAMTSSTAVDIAGIGVMTGFLYSHFVVGPDLTPVTAQHPSLPLLILCEFQQFVVFAGVGVAAFVARHHRWGATYRRLSIGLLVHFIILSISNYDIWQGLYKSGFVYDVIWIMPYAFFPWAASLAPSSAETDAEQEDKAITPSRPWVVFGVLGLIPLADYGLRRALPLGPLEGFRDLFTAITVFSVLPLLMARLAVERGEAQQADSKRRLLAAATEHADDLICVTTADGEIEHANSAFCRALGYPLGVLIHMSVRDVLADQSRSQLDTIGETVRGGGTWRGTLVRLRKDGSTFLTSCTVVSLLNDSGTVTHFVGVERDITAETQMREQLIHSERLAAVGQLVSGVAHELNNPLQAVVGFTELLIESERRQETLADLELVRSEANRAAKIVRNLLAFVRRSSTERATVSVNDVVRSAVALRQYEFGMANIELEQHYDEHLSPVVVNREEIQQVILNLLLNAEHALKSKKGGRLQIRTAKAGSDVIVDVQDDGPGIPAAIAGQIFEPFFSTKDVGQGTGLGLSIALGIAEAHGGKLALAPSSAGACFRLTLPAAHGQTVVPIRSTGDASAWAAAIGRRALVIDDEPPVRELLHRLLVKRGFAVDAAENGEAGLALIKQNRYDIVFCDVQMPKLGGMSVYDTLKRQLPQVLRSFVFITGDILNRQFQTFVDAAKIPLLSKPFGAAKVDAILLEVLSPRSANRQPKTA